MKRTLVQLSYIKIVGIVFIISLFSLFAIKQKSLEELLLIVIGINIGSQIFYLFISYGPRVQLNFVKIIPRVYNSWLGVSKTWGYCWLIIGTIIFLISLLIGLLKMEPELTTSTAIGFSTIIGSLKLIEHLKTREKIS